jgi:hypothetical protein
MAQTSATQRGRQQLADNTDIRPFHVNVPEAELTELRASCAIREYSWLEEIQVERGK